MFYVFNLILLFHVLQTTRAFTPSECKSRPSLTQSKCLILTFDFNIGSQNRVTYTTCSILSFWLWHHRVSFNIPAKSIRCRNLIKIQSSICDLYYFFQLKERWIQVFPMHPWSSGSPQVASHLFFSIGCGFCLQEGK